MSTVNDHPMPPSTLVHKTPQRNEPTYAARSYMEKISGVDLTQIPGFQASSIQTRVSEVGRDRTKWPSEKHFSSWVGLCLNLKRSGGKDQVSKSRRVQSRAARAFRIAARGLKRSTSSLGAFSRRMKGQLGPSKALTAPARKVAGMFYKMVKYGKTYTELGKDYDLKHPQRRQLARLKRQDRGLGCDLILYTPSCTQAELRPKRPTITLIPSRHVDPGTPEHQE